MQLDLVHNSKVITLKMIVLQQQYQHSYRPFSDKYLKPMAPQYDPREGSKSNRLIPKSGASAMQIKQCYGTNHVRSLYLGKSMQRTRSKMFSVTKMWTNTIKTTVVMITTTTRVVRKNVHLCFPWDPVCGTRDLQQPLQYKASTVIRS